MKGTLESAGDTEAGAVAQVIPPSAEAVRVAVEAVATANAVEVRGEERRLSHQMDSGMVAVQSKVESGVERVVGPTTEAAAHVKKHVDERLNRVEGELGRLREVMARIICEGLLPSARARQLVNQELSRSPDQPPSTTAAASVRLSASEGGTIRAAPPPCRVSQRLLVDRERVRSLQAAGRLAGVPIYGSSDECVWLLPMAPQLNWKMALDEYTTGLEVLLSICEAEQLFGNRWRLWQPGSAKARVVKLSSERHALYRAFDAENSRLGHRQSVDGAVAVVIVHVLRLVSEGI